MGKALRIIGTVIASYTLGMGILLFIGPQGLEWYGTLAKPPLMPPEWSFVPLWLIFYTLMVLALALVWTAEEQNSRTRGWVRFYFIQLLFNLAWVGFFFWLHATLIAFIAILFLAFILIALIAEAWEIDRHVSYILAPYFLAILFIAFQNLNIWFLN